MHPNAIYNNDVLIGFFMYQRAENQADTATVCRFMIDHQFQHKGLKFKLHGLVTKSGMFEAKMMDAAQYMWKLLASAWYKKSITVDPLQITMEFTRNFPLDTLSEAQTVQALIGAGLPKEVHTVS